MLLVYLVIDDSNTFPKILDPWVLIFSDTLITYFRVIHLKLEDNFEPQLLCETCVSKGAITHLSYSPAGNMLAAVSGSFLFILVEHFNEDLEEKVWVASERIQVCTLHMIAVM